MNRQSLSFSGKVLRTQAFRRMQESLNPISSPANAHPRVPGMAFSRSSQLLFSQLGSRRLSFAERFPRTMIALIAAALFAITVLAEVESLRLAGYVWR
jgi:hypothetical protein